MCLHRARRPRLNNAGVGVSPLKKKILTERMEEERCKRKIVVKMIFPSFLCRTLGGDASRFNVHWGICVLRRKWKKSFSRSVNKAVPA